VEDTGGGISAQVREHIFEPFFSTKESAGVKGLGLSIVQDIVKTHGGRVEVNSVPGRGTRIGLYFPLPEEPSSGGAPAEGSSSIS
jgi:two-component system, NtrC family, sensor kinase